MLKINKWRDADAGTKDAATRGYLQSERDARNAVADSIVSSLVDFGIGEGYTDTQIRAAVETVFSTFGIEFFLYLQIASGTLSAAIAADVTIPWLDTDVGGTPLRTRLIDRLE